MICQLQGMASQVLQMHRWWGMDLTIKENNLPFKTITKEMVGRINTGMPEIYRAINVAGRSDTQFKSKNMNVFMLGRTPFTIMNQAMLKIERSKQAIIEAEFRHEKNMLLIKKYLEQADQSEGVDKELLELKVRKKKHEIEASILHIEGAYKNIADYLSIYQQAKEAAGIPDNWDELDYERAEVQHHIKQVFIQALREVIGPGRVNPGNMEYFDNCGIGGIIGLTEIQGVLEFWRDNGITPDMIEIDKWLSAMAEKYKEYPGRYLATYGINQIDEWYIFKDRNKEITDG